MDCPYYEQLQYAGDTRIQALISLYMTGDDRLAKNAIESLNESRTPDGLTQSRYPSFLPQYIPPFSLLWIGMMHDLWWYRGEADFLRQYLPGMRDVIGWFESRLAPSGLLGRLEWWDFVDWTKDFEDGVPPQEANGQSAILSLQFAAILREAADLESSFGSAEKAEHDRKLAAFKLVVLLPLLAGVVVAFLKKRGSMYAPLIYAAGIAVLSIRAVLPRFA